MSTETLMRVIQFLVSISLLVVLHEGGHFFFAKLFKTRVNKFYMFFNPYFSLFRIKKLGGRYRMKFFCSNTPDSVTEKTNLEGKAEKDENGKPVYRAMTEEEVDKLPSDDWRREPDNTEFGIGWVPLGGYCSIVGMVDETKSASSLASEQQPWEYRSKKIWQRFLIITGGVLVNFLLALFIYSMIMMKWGDSYTALRDLTMGMEYNETAHSIGFQDGDIPVKIDGKEYMKYDVDLLRGIADGKEVTVLRNGEETVVHMPNDMDLIKMAKEVPPFLRVIVPAVIDSVMADSPAAKLGLAKGDLITDINGQKITSYGTMTDIIGRLSDKMIDAVSPKDSLLCRTVSISYAVNGDTAQAKTDTIVLTSDMKIGAYFPHYAVYYEPTHVTYGFLESFPAGIAYGCNVLKGYVSDLKYLFSGEGVKSLGGFGTIASLFPTYWDWFLFWKMTAFLSIILAFMNILPIPALDGGYALMLIFEAITGRKPSDKFMEKAGTVGFIILVLLLIVANLNDVLRWLGMM